MIIPDVNLLVYAYDSSSPFHTKAAAWWSNYLSGAEPVGLPQVVAFGFMRLVTNPRVCANPMTPAEAAAHVRSWLAQPCVQVLSPSSDHIEQVLHLLEKIGAGANLVTDAQLAALTLKYKAVLHTSDTDFLRFSGLAWFNPITGDRSSSPQRRS